MLDFLHSITFQADPSPTIIEHEKESRMETRETTQAERRSQQERRKSDRRLADAAAFDAWLALGKPDRRSGLERRSGSDRRRPSLSRR
jgi:hypothetical protein